MAQLNRDRSIRSVPNRTCKRYATPKELKRQATRLGLPTGAAVLPEQEMSPSYGDPTLVDDRPFAGISPAAART